MWLFSLDSLDFYKVVMTQEQNHHSGPLGHDYFSGLKVAAEKFIIGTVYRK